MATHSLEEENALLSEQVGRLKAENMDLKQRTLMMTERMAQLEMKTEQTMMQIEMQMRKYMEQAEIAAMLKAKLSMVEAKNADLEQQLKQALAQSKEAAPSEQTNLKAKEINCKNREGFEFKLFFDGPLDEHGLPKGPGAAKCSDGRTYDGFWTSGKSAKGHYSPYFANGKGKIKYPDGGSFIGTVRSSSDQAKLLRRGEGTLHTSSGLTIDGSWNDKEQLEDN